MVIISDALLTFTDCESVISTSERMGYRRIDSGKLNRNSWVTWLLDKDAVSDPLFKRCEHFLPSLMHPPESASLNSRQLAGLNQRVRLYKYENNDADEFKLHRDDSNPGADFGRNAEGGVDRTMMNWDHDGDRQSLLHFCFI